MSKEVFRSLLLICGIALSPSALAETDAQALRALLGERDAAIIELQATVRQMAERLDKLERQLGDEATSTEPEPVAATSSSSPQAARYETTETEEDFGRLDVDELAAQRALERTLTQEGALLLPSWTFEVEPSFTYGLDQFEIPTRQGGAQEEFGLADFERQVYVADVEFRMGLPFDSQFEIGVPYSWVDDSLAAAPTAGIDSFDRSGQGLGSVRLGIAKTLLREQGWRPDLVGRIFWNTGSGDERDNEVFIGGFESVGVVLSAVKRADPLAFVGSVQYQTFSADDDGTEPGDLFAFSVGSALAVSPSTSMFASLSNQFFDESRVNDLRVRNSDLAAIVLNLGASKVIDRGVLLSVSSGIGISDEAPDYSIGVAATFRSDLLRRLGQ
jgi:hypothetical protein